MRGAFLSEKIMPRNASGIYAPPPGTTLTPNTLADATALEARLSDMGAELSASMPLNGVRPMTAPLLVAGGSAAAPGLGFAGDTSSGLAQVSSRTALVKGGVQGVSMSATDVQVHLPLTLTGGITGGGFVPSGAVLDFAGATAPDGWLICDGRAVSRTTFAVLFAAIGTAYGAGDGSTTFSLPDARGRVTAGLDNMGGSDAGRMSTITGRATLGGSGGTQTHALDQTQMPSHGHSGTTSTDGGHSHSASYGFSTGGSTSFQGGGFYQLTAIPTDTAGAHAHTFTTNTTGGGGAHNNVQPTLFLNKIIKT
jgi:microcystin-dependent protein